MFTDSDDLRIDRDSKGLPYIQCAGVSAHGDLIRLRLPSVTIEKNYVGPVKLFR